MQAAALDLEEVKQKRGRRYALALSKIRESAKTPEVALPYTKVFEILADSPKTKFDQSVHISLRLGVDPKQADQMVRGAVTLPHGLGKSATIVVFAKGEKAREAEQAGADHVGAEDIVEKFWAGWQEFSAVVATPDMMGVVSKLGRVLGPRGLMPNPKVGTVTFDVGKTVQELKKGRVEFRVEKAGIIQASIGKVSFGAQKLTENFSSLVETILRIKPASVKGAYILSLFVSTTMGPSIRVDHQDF